MYIEEITAYCSSKPNVTSGYPFRKETLVFKVKEKVFCLVRTDQQPLTINVKCEPDAATELREKYAAITPGYHMNKKYWNTITLDGSIKTALIKKFIDDSYQLVAPKKAQ